MSDNSQKSRERAESAFAKARTQFMSRSRIASERDAVSAAQDAKSARLRALRLAKEAAEPAKSAPVRAVGRQAKGRLAT
jgi:hypothetical protein